MRQVCLGNMGHVRGAAAVREAKKDYEKDPTNGSVDVVVGVLAIQLGLLDDAARIFREVAVFLSLLMHFSNCPFLSDILSLF